MNQSEQINELATALAKAQGSMKSAVEDSVNPFYKSSYANLTSIWNACRQSLSTNGLSVVQAMENINAQLILITTLAHSSGQWIRSSVPVISEKTDCQSIGKAITYMRRYTLAALVGITSDSEDDDGNEASGIETPKKNGNGESKSTPDYPINEIQFWEINELLMRCSDQFRTNILKICPNNDLKSLLSSKFEPIKNAALTHIKEKKNG